MEPRYLVVDDSLTVVHAVRSILEAEGESREAILTAHTATEAVELMEEHEPETVFLDIDLPDMGGHELAKDLRERAPDSRVIMVTGLTLEDRRVRTVLEDLDVEFLEKPLERADLRELGVGARPSVEDPLRG